MYHSKWYCHDNISSWNLSCVDARSSVTEAAVPITGGDLYREWHSLPSRPCCVAVEQCSRICSEVIPEAKLANVALGSPWPGAVPSCFSGSLVAHSPGGRDLALEQVKGLTCTQMTLIFFPPQRYFFILNSPWTVAWAKGSACWIGLGGQ